MFTGCMLTDLGSIPLQGSTAILQGSPRRSSTPTTAITQPQLTSAKAVAWVVMRWPPWSSESNNDEKQTSSSSTNSILDWKAYTEPRTLVPTLVLTSGILLAVRFHRSYLRRIPDAPSISSSWLRRRSVFGQVTSVGDGDNFRIFHTPGGRLAGWGWLPWKKVPTNKKELKDNTVRTPCFPNIPLLPSPIHIYVQYNNLPDLDPHPTCGHRCSRTRAFRSSGTAFCARRSRMAYGVPERTTSARARPPPRSVFPGGGERCCAAGIRFSTFQTARCVVRDAPSWAGDCV